MITLTDTAKKKLMEHISNNEDCVRLYVEAGGCSGFQYGITIDQKKNDDALHEIEGLRVIIDPNSATYLEGANVDYLEEMGHGGFTINNPNAKSSCGCGKSFSS